ncbi:MAG: sn-glycerol-1-phosphate dehydrogenase [Clostridia bacterium]|nr:sn-glycerol-1-phosphate dehydrogenase [Clostridia bacterium]
MNYDLNSLMKNDGFVCPSCGRTHFGLLRDCFIGDGVMNELPGLVNKYGGKKPFVLCDTLTYEAAGEWVCRLLDEAKIPYALHIIQRIKPSPDEEIVGEAVMYCPLDCDLVIAVGGGVINDTGKILAAAKNVPQIIVATAPSMDGFASASSSMERSGLKVSLNSKCPDAVIGEAEILAKAPVHMIRSGVGDMLAKYVSIAEWQIANLIVGDYYCETIAEIVRCALDQCVKSAKAAVEGDKKAVCAVMEGLVLSGLAMNYAGISRPASGMEHYISHIIDMRALEFGTPSDFHGIQCGIGTLMTIRAYEGLMQQRPEPTAAREFANSFDLDGWYETLTEKLGHGAEAIIAGDRKEKKYDSAKHADRLAKIVTNWGEIQRIASKMPRSADLAKFMKDIGHPTTGEEIGLTEEDMADAFFMAKDIRDKYVLGRLLWDLGKL